MDTEKDHEITIDELSEVVSAVLLQGTTEERQQLAAILVEAQQHLLPEDAPFKRFYTCLIAALRGEAPEIAQLESPFTEVWQELQERLRAPLKESSQ